MSNYLVTDTEILTTASKIKQKINNNNLSINWESGTGFATSIENIVTGTNTSDANATSNDILASKTAYVNGAKITGNIPTKTTNDVTVSGASITIPTGYFPMAITKSVTTTTHPNPTVAISSTTGLITASHVQSTGYVTGGTTTKTLQLTTQAAQTITPGTANKTAVAAGKYTTGNVVVAGNANLVAGNIKKGTNIFGVTGTYEGSLAGSNTVIFNNTSFSSIIRSNTFNHSNLVTINCTGATTIGASAFEYCSTLTTVNFPNVTSIGTSAFLWCSNLTAANFPKATSIGDLAFWCCLNLTTVSFPNVTTISNEAGTSTNAFVDCRNLKTISFPKISTIKSHLFQSHSYITSAYFTGATVIGSSAFYSCSNLTTISFPNVTTIGYGAFCWCSNLTAANFPKATSIGDLAFWCCLNLTTVSFPNVTTISNEAGTSTNAFVDCHKLKTISFPKVNTIKSCLFKGYNEITSAYFTGVTVIGSSAFQNCTALTTFYPNITAIPTLYNSNAFSNVNTNCKFYIKSSLFNSYKTATHWTYYSAKMVSY